MNIWVILLIILLLGGAFGTLPNWGHAQNWNAGYWPSGGLGLVLIVIVILLLTGRL